MPSINPRCHGWKTTYIMNNLIGIRHEDKYVMERRVPLTPLHIKNLISNHHLSFNVQSSPKRVFPDNEFEIAGAKIVNDLSDCPIIFGVKEMPLAFFEMEKTYMFFSHVIKGQSYNMPMLKKMMELKCNLIDYEKVVNDTGQRLIFFGRFAGLAGMINSLWSLGQRLTYLGISTPFERIQQSHKYHSLEEARQVVSEVGQEIAENGLPAGLTPLVIGFTGYGNVSNGAQEIASLLPLKEINPHELASLEERKNLPGNVIYKVVFREEHIMEPIESNDQFELLDYYQYPEKYKSQFEQYIPHLTVLMNCMYWDDRYPKIVTKDYLRKLYSSGEPRVKVIGDITCDPDGSIECTYKGTEIEDPVFVYNPFTEEITMGFKGDGILDMAVDILPSELPRESSIAFGDVLWKFIEGIAAADYDRPFEELNLPGPIKTALILHKGELTPEFKYIKEFL